MDKTNQALTYLASGQIPQNSNSYTALNIKKSEMITFASIYYCFINPCNFWSFDILIHSMNDLTKFFNYLWWDICI